MKIAIDGPAASGKGTIARKLATHLELPYLDTGKLYRALAFLALEQKAALEDEKQLAQLASSLDMNAFEDTELRSANVGEAASQIAALEGVRAALLTYQRDFASQKGGAILDGRDIGSFILPDADVKLFITASPEIRAERRLKELLAKGENTDFATVLHDIKVRDERDCTRKTAPLIKMEDAHLIDTTNLGIEAAFKASLQAILAQ